MATSNMLPPLSKVIDSTKALAYYSPSQYTPRQEVDLYADALAFLCHLRQDKEALSRANGEEIDTPAIRAVLDDQQLYEALFNMLTSRNPKIPPPPRPVLRLPEDSSNKKKRTFSVSSDTSTDIPSGKRMKQDDYGSFAPMKKQEKSDFFDLHVFAACVLYSVFRFVEHWPASLAQAYAEDIFGSRSWVDDTRCAHFVELLNSVLDPDVEEVYSLKKLDRAAKVAIHLSYNPVEDNEKNMPPPQNFSENIKNMANKSAPTNGTFARESSQQSSSGQKDEIKDSDSDSGSEVELVVEESIPVAITTSISKPIGAEVSDPSLANRNLGVQHEADDDSSSGSSIGEDEEVIIEEQSFAFEASDVGIDPSITSESLFVTSSKFLDIKKRYVGENKRLAFLLISKALDKRLEAKSKQNLSLLSALGPFVKNIPAVRRCAARNFEKWLQSPALSGLARTLLTTTVESIQKVEPPLSEDLEVIDCLLAMKVKANQLQSHIERFERLSKRLISNSVCKHMMLHILLHELGEISSQNAMQSSQSQTSDYVRLFNAIFLANPPEVRNTSFAHAVIHVSGVKHLKDSGSKISPHVMVLLKRLVLSLGPSYDFHNFTKALLDESAIICQNENMSAGQAHLFSLLIFECITLGKEVKGDVVMEEVQKIASYRKLQRMLLFWFLNIFAPTMKSNIEREEVDESYQVSISQEPGKKQRKRGRKKNAEDPPSSAGPVQFDNTIFNSDSKGVYVQHLLRVFRCLLFLEDPSSPLYDWFVTSSIEDIADGVCGPKTLSLKDRFHQIQSCHKNFLYLDEKIMKLILEGTLKGGITISSALCIIETILQSCGGSGAGIVTVRDPSLISEIYQISEYHYSESSKDKGIADLKKIEKLARPGIWWRITTLSLVLCAFSPEQLGSFIWKANPTLSSLIKMILTGYYRFPSIDCSDDAKRQILLEEDALKEEEKRIASELFLSPADIMKLAKYEEVEKARVASLNRRSRRTGRLLRSTVSNRVYMSNSLDREIEEIKEKLSFAANSIMLMNTTGPPRRPPEKIVQNIIGLEKQFMLAAKFRNSLQPDFLMLTIGKTSRDSLSRAYDWLVPTISLHPSTIKRLPSSASCFLLLCTFDTLKARDDLQSLADPLIKHVRSCLLGQIGKENSILATVLLLNDVSSAEAKRRRCARRVLREIFSCSVSEAPTRYVRFEIPEPHDECIWISSLLDTPFTLLLLPKIIEALAESLKYDEGSLLRSMVMYLQLCIKQAKKQKLNIDYRFEDLLCDMIANRSHVSTALMTAFSDFRDLSLSVTRNEFARVEGILLDDEYSDSFSDYDVKFRSCCSPTDNDCVINVNLLRSAIVLLSCWYDDTDVMQEDGQISNENARHLLDVLLVSNSASVESTGAAGAKFIKSGKRALSLENWLSLTNCRCALIAQRATRSAPRIFLPRLLLCCGLPRASFESMIERLNKFSGHFNDLIAPKATTEWGVHYGDKSALLTTLLSRVQAYHRKNELDMNKAPFVSWLIEECEKQTSKSKSRKNKDNPPREQDGVRHYSENDLVDSIFDAAFNDIDEKCVCKSEKWNRVEEEKDIIQVRIHLNYKNPNDWGADSSNIIKADFWNSFFDRKPSSNMLDDLLLQLVTDHCGLDDTRLTVAKSLLQIISVIEKPYFSIICKYLPLLSKDKGDEEFWNCLFTPGLESSGLLQLLIPRLLAEWSSSHIVACQIWILSIKDFSKYSIMHIVKFLTLSMSLPFNSERPTFVMDLKLPLFITSNNGYFENILKFSIESLRLEQEFHDKENHASAKDVFHDGLPDGAQLILLVSDKCTNQEYCKLIQRLIDSRIIIPLASSYLLLRMYCNAPDKVGDIQNPSYKEFLYGAARIWREYWIEFYCAIDEKFQRIMQNFFEGKEAERMALSDLVTRYPLLFARHLKLLAVLLFNDGAVSEISDNNSISPVLKVSLNNVSVTIRHIKHWGYVYSRMFWSSILEILCKIPPQLLFRNFFVDSGLNEVLSRYLELFVACKLRGRVEDNLSTMIIQFSTLLNEFESFNQIEFENFINSSISSLKCYQNIKDVVSYVLDDSSI